ncbi:hypothetical protein MtrunA17_Chr3g0086381 [Medicago truncatula]|uniref:Uncharacterized protein n=1 Tax=Medicago truncatula TaxID=3880 RepID=A0A396IN86_MEDTR|nr:hypothetical protein MtrunA17_Chr3g0086381 [Medicago truncatula]
MHKLNPLSEAFALSEEAIANANRDGIVYAHVQQKRGRIIGKEERIRKTWRFSRFREDSLQRRRTPTAFSGEVFGFRQSGFSATLQVPFFFFLTKTLQVLVLVI